MRTDDKAGDVMKALQNIILDSKRDGYSCYSWLDEVDEGICFVFVEFWFLNVIILNSIIKQEKFEEEDEKLIRSIFYESVLIVS